MHACTLPNVGFSGWLKIFKTHALMKRSPWYDSAKNIHSRLERPLITLAWFCFPPFQNPLGCQFPVSTQSNKPSTSNRSSKFSRDWIKHPRKSQWGYRKNAQEHLERRGARGKTDGCTVKSNQDWPLFKEIGRVICPVCVHVALPVWQEKLLCFILFACVCLLVRTCFHSDLMLQVFHKGFMSLCLLT